MKLFLSHSSKDKSIVKRIKDDLNSYGYVSWLDNEDIPFGAPIVESIEEGLLNSDILLIFLSQNSVLSKWVQNEWQVKFFQQLSEKKFYVLPILLTDCELPKFLSHIRYLDFRSKDKYEENLSLLLETLNRYKAESENKKTEKVRTNATYTIVDNTKEMLEELEKENIALPVHKKLPIIDTLRKIPRSGKQLRLISFKHIVKVRSVYDHIISVAHTADCLLPYIKHGISKEELAELPRCIAFHELNEVVLGDIPTYTPLSNEKRIVSRVYAEERLRTVQPQKRKQIANDFIWLFLNEKHRRSLEKVNQTLKDVKSNIYITFKTFDKIDPIIATWRYLHFYRGQLGDNPKQFNHKMKDFFENPDVKNFLINNNVDHSIIEMVSFLQDRTNAWDYYENPDKVFNNNTLFSVPKIVIKKVIEGIPLFVQAEKKGKRN
jgi:5'-deoxynucleotidase YfbR-like HD superfamily hydrolase